MKLTSLFKKLKKITPENIKGFVEGYSKYYFNDLMTPLEKEQVEWRFKIVEKLSPECLENKVCKKCGCDIPAKLFESRGCEGNCYPQLMNEKEWKTFKENIKSNG